MYCGVGLFDKLLHAGYSHCAHAFTLIWWNSTTITSRGFMYVCMHAYLQWYMYISKRVSLCIHIRITMWRHIRGNNYISLIPIKTRTYLSRNICGVWECEIAAVGQNNVVLGAMGVQARANRHQQPHSAIVALRSDPVCLPGEGRIYGHFLLPYTRSVW